LRERERWVKGHERRCHRGASVLELLLGGPIAGLADCEAMSMRERETRERERERHERERDGEKDGPRSLS
jgi:hypothetical protein